MKLTQMIGLGGLVGAIVAGFLFEAAPVNAQTIEVRTTREGSGNGYYVAQSGDTLYDLSRRFLGDAMLWPRLWSYNPQITNPHWIYPGDVVFVRPPSSETAVLYEQFAGLYHPLGGFMTAGDIESVGTLRYAQTGRRLLAEYDTVYLEMDDRDSIRIGDEFSLNHIEDVIYGEGDDEVAAVKYTSSGRVQVTGLPQDSDLVVAEITSLTAVIERGDVLFVNQSQLIMVQDRENTVDLEGAIIDQLDEIRHYHEQSYIFIDLGYDDGVRVGNRFFVWDREDEAVMIAAQRNPDIDYEIDVVNALPWQLYGEARVIYTGENYATAVITDAGNHELVDGMRVTLQRGY